MTWAGCFTVSADDGEKRNQCLCWYRNMRDPVTPRRGSLWVLPCETIGAALGALYHLKRVCQTVTAYWNTDKDGLCGLGWFPCSSALGSACFSKHHWPPWRAPRFAPRPQWSQTSEVNSSTWLWCFSFLFGISTGVISLARSSVRKPGDRKYLQSTPEGLKKLTFELHSCFFTSHLQNPVNPDGAVAHFNNSMSLTYESEKTKKKHRQENVVLNSFANQWPMSGHGSADATMKEIIE